MVFLLLVAGHETTTHLLGTGLVTLLGNPDQMPQLQADWSVGPEAVDEILRYNSPVQINQPRFIAEDTKLHGEPVKRGQLSLGSLASANLAPAEFPDPKKVDITGPASRHLTFGRGIHACLGLRLAQLESQIAWQTILTRFPDARLAISHHAIPWGSRVGMRTLSALPIELLPNK